MANVEQSPPGLVWQQSPPLPLTFRAAASASDVEGLPPFVSQLTARLSSAAAKAEVARMARVMRVRENIVEINGLDEFVVCRAGWWS